MDKFAKLELDSNAVRANYHDYIRCLNERRWEDLPLLVAPECTHNGRPLDPARYQAMMEEHVFNAPDLLFRVSQLLVDAPARRVAAQLAIEATPHVQFCGRKIMPRPGGIAKKLRFFEQVIYHLDDLGRIDSVISVLDEDAITKYASG